MIIDLFGDVGYEITLQSIKNQLNNVQDTDNVEINLFSYGGSLNEGLAIHDYLKQYKPTVNVYGLCASAANFIAFTAPKGKLNIYENAEWLSHQARAGAFGWLTEQDAIDLAENLKRANKAVTKLISERTGKDEETVLPVVMNEQFMTANEAKKFGLVDNIVSVSEDIDDKIDNHFNMIMNSAKTDDKNGRFKEYQEWYNKYKENKTQSHISNIDAKQDDIITNKTEVTDMADTVKTEQTSIDMELINSLQNEITELREKLSTKEVEIANSEKDALIKKQNEIIANYESEKKERLLNEAKERNASTIEVMNKSVVQFDDTITNAVESIDNPDVSKTINKLVNEYETTIAQYKQNGEKINIKHNSTNEQVTGLVEGETKISIDSVEYEELMNKIAEEKFADDGDEALFNAMNEIENNKEKYNIVEGK